MYPEILKKYNIRLNRDLGQHFLTDRSILDRIVDAGSITKNDIVLEVGTGIGTLTKHIASKAGFVVTVELDDKLIPPAKEYLSGLKNVEIVQGDIMKCDIEKIMGKYPKYKHRKAIANVPYYITSPLIAKLLESKPGFETIVFTIQKEVAERIVSKPGVKAYGSFSIFVNYYAKPEIKFYIPNTAFTPSPEVDSAVIKLTVLDRPSVKVKDEKLFFKIVHAAFMQRRKMLHNAIINANIDGISKEKLENAFERTGIDGNRRGETLSIEEFGKLSDCLS